MNATVDRIEEGFAVLITSGEKPARILLPVSMLPEGSQEGDVVTLTIGRDQEATSNGKGRVAGLVDRLKKNQA
jgi:hypothetical protein